MKKSNNKSQKSIPRIFFSGFAMGSADIVPGVSGGTIALIMGVYEELIQSIKIVSGDVLKLTLKGNISQAIKTVPFRFLVPLFAGLLTAVITLAKSLEWLLLNQPTFVWAFFFGLVLASIVLIGKKVTSWNLSTLVSLVIGTVLVYLIVGLVPVETPANPIAFLISGAIAICAMIMPGISGSFLLIIMGKYSQILGIVSDLPEAILSGDWPVVTSQGLNLGIFMIGAVVGLALFSRLLSWMFAHHHDLIMAFLTGVLVGSLRKLWPWKQTIETYIDSHGVEMPLIEANIAPPAYDTNFLLVIILVIVGATLITFLGKFEKE